MSRHAGRESSGVACVWSGGGWWSNGVQCAMCNGQWMLFAETIHHTHTHTVSRQKWAPAGSVIGCDWPGCVQLQARQKHCRTQLLGQQSAPPALGASGSWGRQGSTGATCSRLSTVSGTSRLPSGNGEAARCPLSLCPPLPDDVLAPAGPPGRDHAGLALGLGFRVGAFELHGTSRLQSGSTLTVRARPAGKPCKHAGSPSFHTSRTLAHLQLSVIP